jgi:Putative quorum-sensing-regulated virulence factor
VIMPFGKHRGVRLELVPPDYLLWCLDNVEKLSPTLRHAIRERLGLTVSARIVAPEAVRGQVKDTVKSWYRHASRKHHPDHGGSSERMLVVNDAYESLVEAIDDMEITS